MFWPKEFFHHLISPAKWCFYMYILTCMHLQIAPCIKAQLLYLIATMTDDVISYITDDMHHFIFVLYHQGYSHSTLLVNNIGRGVPGEQGRIEDYSDLINDVAHTWFLPEHGTNTRFPTCMYANSHDKYLFMTMY